MENKKEFLHKIYKIVFYVLTFSIGCLFILFAYTIYFKGKEMLATDPTYQIYTLEVVKKYLGYILIPFILWVLLIIGGNVLSFIYPVNKKNNIKIDCIHKYNHLKNKVNILNVKDKDRLSKILKERKLRNIYLIAASIISLLCMIYPAIYLFDINKIKNETFII